MSKTQILGTGLSGLVGTRVTELLADKFDFVDFSLNTGVNILDYYQLEGEFLKYPQSQAVIHMAAFTDTNAAWNQKGNKGGLCYELNVIGTRNIVDLCQKYKKYLIYISTDFVFDGSKDGTYDETDKPSPIEWYGQTKYWGEQQVKNSGHPAAIVRIAFPYRTKFDGKPDIVRKIVSKLEAGEKVTMFNDQITTPTFVDDIAYSLGFLLENQPTGVYHVVGSSSQSPHELAKNIAATFNLDEKLVEASSLAEMLKNQPAGSRPWQKNLALSNQKFVAQFNYVPKNLQEGLLILKSQQ